VNLSCLEVAQARLGEGTRKGKEWAFLCPFHNDSHASLLIDPEKDVWHCFPCDEGGNAWEFAAKLAGCPPDEKKTVVVWLSEHGLSNGNVDAMCSRMETEYVYRDAEGNPVMMVARFHPKSFCQYRYEAGKWVPGLKDKDGNLTVTLVPYRLPELLKAKYVFVVEGEKDADRLASVGLTATCNPMGAGKWRDEYPHWFEHKPVIILPDNDEAGKRHACQVARSLFGTAKAVKLVELPGLKPKGDVSDWLAQGHTKAELLALVKTTPELSEADIRAWPCETTRATTTEADPAVPVPRWPIPKAEALYGLAGDIVKAIEPHTEADSVALLLQILACFGNVIGSRAYFPVEADRHHGNLFVTLVGDTSKERKGTSFGHVLRLFKMIDSAWADSRRMRGLASGEGLIEKVRDTAETKDPKKDDPGVDDKRLMVTESEFCHVLKVMERQGCTLSDTLRSAWDADVLENMARNKNGLKATGAHVSIIAHITKTELLRYLTATEAANGLANRFLWACVKRSKELPEGGNLTKDDLEPHVERLRLAVSFARQAGEIRRDEEARTIWRHVYGPLSGGKPGLLGAMIARAEAQVVRLSLLYSLLDCSPVIRREHLLAALALWNYCEDSAKYIFGDCLGDPTADAILAALRAAGAEGMTRTQIRDYFGRHKGAAEIQRALTALADQGFVKQQLTATDGRPEERWRTATNATKAT